MEEFTSINLESLLKGNQIIKIFVLVAYLQNIIVVKVLKVSNKIVPWVVQMVLVGQHAIQIQTAQLY